MPLYHKASSKAKVAIKTYAYPSVKAPQAMRWDAAAASIQGIRNTMPVAAKAPEISTAL